MAHWNKVEKSNPIKSGLIHPILIRKVIPKLFFPKKLAASLR